MLRGNPAIVNPHGLRDQAVNDPGFSDISNKKRVFADLTGAGIFVTLGQSRIANISASGSTPYTPTHGVNCLNINPYDGRIYKLVDPVLGASAVVTDPAQMTGWHGRLADRLVTAGKYTTVVFLPIAIGGTSITDWATGGVYQSRILVAASILIDLGLTPTAWLLQIGTTDSIAGMTQATWQTNARDAISYARSLPGRSVDKWMIAQDTINGTGNSTSTAIRAAQAAVAGDANNFLGPDCDTLTYPTNSDGTHFNATGNDAVAGLWSTKIQAAF